MEIQIDPHTLERAKERGANETEIKDVIGTGTDIPAKYQRKGRYKVYEFKRERNHKFYDEKKIEVYYIIEHSKIVTVTVYIFYGRWE